MNNDKKSWASSNEEKMKKADASNKAMNQNKGQMPQNKGEHQNKGQMSQNKGGSYSSDKRPVRQ